jgi:hypothetical protein
LLLKDFTFNLPVGTSGIGWHCFYKVHYKKYHITGKQCSFHIASWYLFKKCNQQLIAQRCSYLIGKVLSYNSRGRKGNEAAGALWLF